MKITVKLIGPFVQLFGFGEKELDVPPGEYRHLTSREVAQLRSRAAQEPPGRRPKKSA